MTPHPILHVSKHCGYKSWWSKLLALVVIVCYFVAVVMIHDQPYLWLTLTFAVILCLTTLACSRDDPIIAFRRGGPTPRASISEEREHPLEIWITDVPPTYSFIMANATPPPSYGSAIFKFPAVAAAAEKLEKSEGLTNTNSTPMLRRVLDPNRFRSVSRQVSEIGRLSRQVSESGIGRLSRQSSINASEMEEATEDWESGIVIIVPPRLRRTISQNSDAFLAMRATEDLNDSGRKQDTPEIQPAEPAAQEVQPDREISSAVFTCNTDGTKRTVIVVNVTEYNDLTEDNESCREGVKSDNATPPTNDVRVDVEGESETEPTLPDRLENS